VGPKAGLDRYGTSRPRPTHSESLYRLSYHGPLSLLPQLQAQFCFLYTVVKVISANGGMQMLDFSFPQRFRLALWSLGSDAVLLR
jgi:hypothetical protein